MDQVRKEFLKNAYKRHSDEVVRYLSRLLRGNREEAQDIAQTAFLRMEALRDPVSVESTRAFLFRTAKNLVVDGVRRKATQDRYAISVDAEHHMEARQVCTPEEIVIQRERLRLIDNVIENLPPKRRRAFILNRVYGLSYEEIALELGIGKEGVRKHVGRALSDCAAATAKFYENNDAKCEVTKPMALVKTNGMRQER